MSFPGDGALAVFGAPVATPDHSLMAAAAAAALRDPGLKRINTDLETAGFDPIALDVAVASGPAAVGVIGASPRWEYAAIGEVTSRAIAATTA